MTTLTTFPWSVQGLSPAWSQSKGQPAGRGQSTDSVPWQAGISGCAPATVTAELLQHSHSNGVNAEFMHKAPDVENEHNK